MSTIDHNNQALDNQVSTGASRPVINRTTAPRKLHRLSEVRHQQGVSLRRVARQLNADIREVRRMEDPGYDMPLSTLYRWQQVLDVPVSEMLVDDNAPLSAPVMERARMVKVMKSAMAILEKTENTSVRRMAEGLVEQLIEIMPELDGVSPWHAVGQRRTLDELGRAVERGMHVDFYSGDD